MILGLYGDIFVDETSDLRNIMQLGSLVASLLIEVVETSFGPRC